MHEGSGPHIAGCMCEVYTSHGVPTVHVSLHLVSKMGMVGLDLCSKGLYRNNDITDGLVGVLSCGIWNPVVDHVLYIL